MADTNNITIHTERKWGCLLFLLVFVVGLILGCSTAKRHFRDTTKMVVKCDTTYVYDTTRIVLPQETKYIKTTDTLLVRVMDTLVVKDTIYMVLQKEVKEYKGEEYFAKVSGYRPSLDYIEVYPKTTIITKTERMAPDKNKVALGINVGYLDAFSIPIYLEYERMLHHYFSFQARLLYNLPRHACGIEVGGKVKIEW